MQLSYSYLWHGGDGQTGVQLDIVSRQDLRPLLMDCSEGLVGLYRLEDVLLN